MLARCVTAAALTFAAGGRLWGAVGLGVSLWSPAAISTGVGSVKFEAGLCEARVRRLLNKAERCEAAEHA